MVLATGLSALGMKPGVLAAVSLLLNVDLRLPCPGNRHSAVDIRSSQNGPLSLGFHAGGRQLWFQQAVPLDRPPHMQGSKKGGLQTAAERLEKSGLPKDLKIGFILVEWRCKFKLWSSLKPGPKFRFRHM